MATTGGGYASSHVTFCDGYSMHQLTQQLGERVAKETQRTGDGPYPLNFICSLNSQSPSISSQAGRWVRGMDIRLNSVPLSR